MAEELPFKIRSEKDCKDKFWLEQEMDYGEKCIPSHEGILTEVLYMMRGTEVSTIYLLWAGVVIINAMLKREAWIQWYPEPLYPNLYCCLVGDAGIKKGVPMNVWYKILKNAMEECKDDPFMKVAKDLKIVKDKTTPEALLDSLLPDAGDIPTKKGFKVVRDAKGDEIRDKEGFVMQYECTSEALVFVDELNVLFSKATYSSTMSEILLALYDSHAEWGFKTKGSGQQYLKNVCTTMIGATTPSALRTSLPENMLGDGFLSRTTLVHLPVSRKDIAMPRSVEGAPGFKELGMKLSYIAATNVGEHTLSKEAYKLYEEWYARFKEDLRGDPEHAGVKSRKDKILLKVALAMKAQRYCGGNVIEKCDMEDAIRLLDTTYGEIGSLINSISKKEFMQEYQKVLNLFIGQDTWYRADIVAKARIPSELLNKVLDQLRQEKKIVALKNGQSNDRITNSKREMYLYVGGNNKSE